MPGDIEFDASAELIIDVRIEVFCTILKNLVIIVLYLTGIIFYNVIL